MYKIVLIDDEELVIKSLSASVEWEQYGFEVAGYALNGEEALALFEEIKPDLIFTDIRMPGISGLELIKMTKKKMPELLTIIVSGHAEFALAQKAIQYGVMGYCLKPFDETEIISFLVKAKQQLDQTKMNYEIDLLDLIEENSKSSQKLLSEQLQHAGIMISPDHQTYVLVWVGKDRPERRMDVSGSLSIKIGYNKYACLLTHNVLDEIMQRYEREAEPNMQGIGVSESIVQISQLKKAIQQAELNAYRFFTMGTRQIYWSADYPTVTEYSLQQLQKAFVQQDIPAVCTMLDSMQAIFANGQFTIRHALLIYNDAMSFLSDPGSHNEDYFYSFDELAGRFINVQDMLRILKELIAQKSVQASEHIAHRIKNPTFMSIFQHVNERFYHNLTLQSISSAFNVNANYVSQLFKKEVGLTFTEYVTKLRMDYACSLLKTSDLTIQDIAEKVGINDYFYFSRIFKRTTGCAPSVYRQEHQSLEDC